LDITTKYGGLENVSPDNKDLLIELAANFPLQLQWEQDDPVMRGGLVVDWSDHSFYTSVVGFLKAQKFTFCYRQILMSWKK